MHAAQAAPRSLAFDYAVGLCCVWISSGFFLDAWAHGHVPVESFFTPYHAAFYSGMFVLVLVFAGFAAYNHARGYAWSDALPRPYRVALIGIPIFILAGLGDMLWHRLLGLEEGVDALLSPTHQVIGLGIFFLSSGPIRSVLYADSQPPNLMRQLPLALGLATWMLLAHFGTAYALDPAAASNAAPPPIAPFTPDYLTALGIGYYKVSLGVLVVILQSALISGFALWLVSRLRPAPGMLTLIYLIGGIPPAAAFTNQSNLLAVSVLQALVAGVVADSFVARWNPRPERVRSFSWFAWVVPMTFTGVYLLANGFWGGIWWDWNVALGAWLWSGVTGYALSFLAAARRSA